MHQIGVRQRDTYTCEVRPAKNHSPNLRRARRITRRRRAVSGSGHRPPLWAVPEVLIPVDDLAKVPHRLPYVLKRAV